MRKAIYMSGRGGQGVLLAGQIMAQAALEAGLNVSWFPVYDAEVRGGRTTCTVVIADGEVGSPIAGRFDAALLFDEIAVERHLGEMAPEGMAVYNTSLAHLPQDHTVRACGLPATRLAEDLGDERTTNMIMLGALTEATGLLSVEQLAAALPAVLPERHHQLIPLNRQAMDAGAAAAREGLTTC